MKANEQQTFFVLIEASYKDNVRMQKSLDGIMSVAAKKKIAVRTTISVTELIELCTSHNEKIIAVLCSSATWAQRVVEKLFSTGIHPIFINMELNETNYPYSSVIQDYRHSAFHLTEMLIKAGQDNKGIAFLGLNPDSYPDSLRIKGFEKAVKDSFKHYKIFKNEGNVDKCINDFMPEILSFETIICANDVIGVALINRLETPSDYNIAGFGGMLVGQYVSPRLTTVVFNYSSAGMYAVDAYSLLSKRDNIHNLLLNVKSTIDIKESTLGISNGQMKRLTVPNVDAIDFYADSLVRDIDRVENMLSGFDELDYQLLKEILVGSTYEHMSEKCFMAINTLKYRIRKMCDGANVLNKKELKNLIEKNKFCFSERI